MGQTKRRLQDRLWDHKITIRTRNKDYPMAVHCASVHDSNPSTLKITGLETVTGSIRKGDRLQRLLQREAFWIFQLRATIFPGLNEEFDLTIFCETIISMIFSPFNNYYYCQFYFSPYFVMAKKLYVPPCNGFFGFSQCHRLIISTPVIRLIPDTLWGRLKAEMHQCAAF